MWVVHCLALGVIVALFLSMISYPPPGQTLKPERHAPRMGASVRKLGRLVREPLLLAVLLCGLPLHEQSWDRLRDLKPGDRMTVSDDRGRVLKGEFRPVSGEAISLQTGNREMAIERAQVRQVRTASGARRVRNL